MLTAKEAGSFRRSNDLTVWPALRCFNVYINAKRAASKILVALPANIANPAIAAQCRWQSRNRRSGNRYQALLAVSAAIIIAIAVRIFRFGALEYNRKLSAKEIFARK